MRWRCPPARSPPESEDCCRAQLLVWPAWRVRWVQVSGIEGTYRMTCESVMRVLRENKGSLMAMLEAFAHDPIINWRLLTDAPATAESKPKPAAATRGPIGGAALLQPQPDTAAAGTAVLREISREKKDFGKSDVDEAPEEILNERALAVISRIHNKVAAI